MTRQVQEIYKNYFILRTPAYFRQFPYEFVHEDYDGPEDDRHGIELTLEDCKREIDNRSEWADKQ